MVFGDVFGLRADYSKGLFYSGRNAIFSETADAKSKPAVPELVRNRSVVARNERKQVPITTPSTPVLPDSIPINSSLAYNLQPQFQESGKNPSNFHIQPRAKSFAHVLKFSKGPKDPKAELEEHRKKKRRNSTLVVIDHSTQVEWKLEDYGGVKMWVHIETGEVSVECPLKTTQVGVPPKSKPKPASALRNSTFGALPSFQMFRKKNRVSIDPNEGSSKKFDNSIRSVGASEKSVYENPEMKELMAMFDNKKSSQKIRAVAAGKSLRDLNL